MIQAKHYVYVWRIKETQEVIYVGKGSGNRWKSMKDRNATFKKIRKEHECECEILKYFEDEEEAFNYEKEIGMYYKSIGQCVGCHEFGKKAKYVDEETLNKMRPTMFKKGHKNSWNKGMKMSDEYRQKCRERMIGTKQSEETKKKRSLSLMGHKVSEKTKESNRKRLSIPILAIDSKTGNILKRYSSSREIADELKVSPASICNWIKSEKEKNGILYIKENQYGNPESV